MKAKRQGTAHRSVLAAALLIAGTMVTVVATATIRARADLPERVVDSIGCQSDANGLSAPSYTRPADYRGHMVPEVLLSGDHARIAAWRKAEGERMTRERRPS